MDTLSILLVEDTPADILLIKEMLSENERLSCNLTEVATLQAAIGLLSRTDFDAVLLDLNLPDSQGVDTVRRVISQFPESAVVVLTGQDRHQTAVQAVRYGGAQDFLGMRDLSPTMLLKSVFYAIERKKFLQEKEDLLDDLALALKRIEALETIMPMCVCCTKILNGKGEWFSIEEYLSHYPADAASRICPECARDLEIEQGEHKIGTCGP